MQTKRTRLLSRENKHKDRLQEIEISKLREPLTFKWKKRGNIMSWSKRTIKSLLKWLSIKMNRTTKIQSKRTCRRSKKEWRSRSIRDSKWANSPRMISLMALLAFRCHLVERKVNQRPNLEVRCTLKKLG